MGGWRPVSRSEIQEAGEHRPPAGCDFPLLLLLFMLFSHSLCVSLCCMLQLVCSSQLKHQLLLFSGENQYTVTALSIDGAALPMKAFSVCMLCLSFTRLFRSQSGTMGQTQGTNFPSLCHNSKELHERGKNRKNLTAHVMPVVPQLQLHCFVVLNVEHYLLFYSLSVSHQRCFDKLFVKKNVAHES